MKYYFILIWALILSGCNTQPYSAFEAETTEDHPLKNTENNTELYEEIGRKAGIERIVDAFIIRIASDEDIMPYFAKSSVSHFKQGFISHLCATIKGPCKYNGDSMVDIHTGMNINEKDFNRVVELLINAMEDVGISYSSQNKILKELALMRHEVIKI